MAKRSEKLTNEAVRNELPSRIDDMAKDIKVFTLLAIVAPNAVNTLTGIDAEYKHKIRFLLEKAMLESEELAKRLRESINKVLV